LSKQFDSHFNMHFNFNCSHSTYSGASLQILTAFQTASIYARFEEKFSATQTNQALTNNQTSTHTHTHITHYSKLQQHHNRNQPRSYREHPTNEINQTNFKQQCQRTWAAVCTHYFKKE
jgi:hypothetical protein